MNPTAIILHDRRFDCYEAYSENGRLIARRHSGLELLEILEDREWEVVSLNSRSGRIIHDKVKGKSLK